jgi:hypothetical protein
MLVIAVSSVSEAVKGEKNIKSNLLVHVCHGFCCSKPAIFDKSHP